MQILAAFLIGAFCGILFMSLLAVNNSKEELEPRNKEFKRALVMKKNKGQPK